MLEDQADEWFSTHDTSLVPGEPDMGGDVTATLETVSIPIFGSEVEKLKKRAAALGTDYRSYIRLLISRHLHEEEPLG